MRSIHIRSDTEAVAQVAGELARSGQPCTYGVEIPPGAEYVLVPTGRIGQLAAAEAAKRILKDLEHVRSGHPRIYPDRDYTFIDFWKDMPEAIRTDRDSVRQQESQIPDYAKRTRDTTLARKEPEPFVPAKGAVFSPTPTATGSPVIIHVMPWDLTVGGGQRMLDDWCTHEGKTWDVHIVTAGLSPGFWGFKGATIHRANTAAELADLCKQLRPEVVVTHNTDYAMSAGARLWPQVWYAHGCKILDDQRQTWAVPHSVLCNFPQEAHKSWRGIKRHVIRLGVDTSCFAPEGIPYRGYLVAGIVGRLSKEKVPESFVKELNAWSPGPWRVRFIGEGIRNHHQGWVRENTAAQPWVEFAGDVLPADMPAAYRDLDAVLIPSITETGSYALAEAMASGLPVVCRDLPGPRYCGGTDAPVYASSDAGLLAVLRAWDDAGRRGHRGERSRAWAMQNLDVGRQMQKITAAYAAAAAPRCSVLMPVFNTAAEHLREAVQSVQAQTERLWELVIADDGSTDKQTLLELGILATADPRIRVVRLSHVGLSTALNYGMAACRSDLVARMDSDDWMHSERLARQIEYMRANGHVDVLGTQMSWSSQKGVTEHAAVVDMAVLGTRDFLLNHPTVMFRRHVVAGVGGYDKDVYPAEDFDLWIRLLKARRVIHNLPDVLLRYRVHPGQITWKHDLTDAGRSIRARNNVSQLPQNGLGAVFDDIYKGGIWGPPLSSGDGSTPQATKTLKRALPELLKARHVARLLDAGCGASTWVREALPPTVTEYTGMDVSTVIVEANGRKEPRAGWQFIVGDISNGKVPKTADLILCRDVLTHLPQANVMMALRNAKAAAPLLLTTHWPDATNRDIAAGDWRPLNLQAEPYCLPPPLEVIAEVDAGKCLVLFDLSKWVG
jgi:glycosyltransferase involved in cell wall biosynthesis